VSLTHYSDKHIVRLLATATRRADVSPHDLSRSHHALGRFLACELVDRLPLEATTIAHPQGPATGFQLAEESRISVVCFLRAGLYVTEGVREVLQHAPLFHIRPVRALGLSPSEAGGLGNPAGRTFVLVDSVVNTGASLEPVLQFLTASGAARIFTLSLVTPESTALRLASAWPQVDFLFARVSNNQYTGKGTTDTGNRLFGTFAD